MKKYSYT